MNRDPVVDVFLTKAQASLAGASSELANSRYDNCANRSYYSCFQAAVAALLQAGARPPRADAQWSHAYVQAEFVRLLIDARKRYPSSLRDTLSRLLILRVGADYRSEQVTHTQAQRAFRRATTFVEAITEGGETR